MTSEEEWPVGVGPDPIGGPREGRDAQRKTVHQVHRDDGIKIRADGE